MDFFELIRKRRSVRAYARRKLEPEKLEAVLDAARLGPSAGDLQGYGVVVVRSSARKEALARAAYDQTFIVAAPAVLVFLADPERSRSKYGERGAELYCLQDATIAATYAQLAASAVGLATCWLGSFDPDKVAEAVQARPPLWPVALLTLAHAAETPDAMPRRAIEDLVSEETVGARWHGTS